MTKELKSSIKNCIHNLNANKRYMRPEEAAVYKLGDSQGGTVFANL